MFVNVLKINRYQRWFRKISNGDFDLPDSDRSEHPVEYDKSLMETKYPRNRKHSSGYLINSPKASSSKRDQVHRQLHGFQICCRDCNMIMQGVCSKFERVILVLCAIEKCVKES